MSLKDSINKGEFVFRFSGLNKLAEPAQSSVIMERNVAMPQTSASTDRVGGVCINRVTEKVSTAEKEVKEMKTEPKKSLGRKADVEAKKDMARPKAQKRKEKPDAVQILIRDLSTEAKQTKASRKKATQDSVKEIIGSE